VPSQDISLGTLGNLGSDGNLWTVQPCGLQTSATPEAPPTSFTSTQLPLSAGFKIVALTVATTPANQARTTLGVGEQVDISLSPALPTYPASRIGWTASAGSVYPQVGNRTRFTAPSNAANATVTMHYQAMAASIQFTVIEPTTVVSAVAVALQYYDTGQAGAGMQLTPYVGPTNVSFYRVQMMEVGQPATGISGYFVSNPPPPHDFAHKADHFDIQLGQDNSWPANYDWATSPVFDGPWSQGQFTWHIPAQWKIDAGPTNNLSGSWDQVFTLAPDGTVTVTKFGHTVTRHTTENYGAVVPDP
jgi:hypothetical protein